MKTFLKAPALALAGMLSLGVFNARPDLEVSASVQIHSGADFEVPLAPIGSWVELRSYGRCWRPAGVAVDWRPYCDGQWEWTDDGWYWESDEPWAWACYHYGTWVYDPVSGWVWVPGVEWAPAWVYWRVSDRFIGWAPCPPHGLAVAPDQFAFVEIGRFNDHVRPSGVILKNESIIRETKEITGDSRDSRTFDGRTQTVVVNRGPDVAVIQKAVGTLKPLSIQDVDRQTRYPAGMRQRPPEPLVPDRAVPLSGENRPPQGAATPSPRLPPANAQPPRSHPGYNESPGEAPRGRGEDKGHD
jgi:hypothetical protein